MRNLVLAFAALLLFAGCVSQPEAAAPGGEQSTDSSAQPAGDGAMATGSGEPAAPDADPGATGGAPAEPVAATIGAAQLAGHSNEADCWVLYGGKVYDVTTYLQAHPGGAGAISAYCGLPDGSFAEAFEGKHGMSKVEVLREQGILKGDFAQ